MNRSILHCDMNNFYASVECMLDPSLRKYPVESMGTVWAYFRHLSGKEVFAAATVNYREELLFQVNYRPDITTTHGIRYNGVLYDITRVDVFEGYKRDLTLYCSRRTRQ